MLQNATKCYKMPQFSPLEGPREIWQCHQRSPTTALGDRLAKLRAGRGLAKCSEHVQGP